MPGKPTYEELTERIAFLENESSQRKRFEAINSTLFKISTAVNTTSSLDGLFKAIHLALSSIIDTTNFYIALYDKAQDSVSFPYIVDTVDECYPPIANISKTATLTAEVLRTRGPVMVTKAEIFGQRNASDWQIPARTPAEIWLGVPLKAQDEIIGVMALQNYHDPLCYDQTDMQVLVAVADQVATVLERKQTEEALRESEIRFRKLLQNLPSIAVQGYDSTGKTQYWNHASEGLYGYTEQEAIGRNLIDLIIPPEIRGDVEQAIQQMSETGQPIPPSELSLMRKDGSRVPVFSNHTIVKIPGRPQELFCIDIDLSERKQAENALRQEQLFSKSVIESLPGIFYLYSYPELRLVLWNKVHESLLGFSSGEMEGRHLTAWHVPEAQEAVLRAVDTVMKDGQNSIEAPLLAKDGRLVPFILTGVKFEAQGRFFLMGIGIDITVRKLVEEALQKSESKLTSYSNQMEQFSLSAASMLSLEDEGLIFAKISQAIVEYSDYRRVLISLFKDEAPYRDLIGHGGVSQEIVEKLRTIPLPKSWYDNVFKQGIHMGQFSYYIPHTMKGILNEEATVFGTGPPPADDSAWHPEDNLFVRMNDEKGVFIGVISVDEAKSGHKPTLETIRPLEVYSSLISQIIILKREQKKRKRLEEQFRQAQKMESVGRLAGGVAHDFNNMLGVILGHAEMAMDQLDPNLPLYADLQEISKAAERSADITRQLLAFARKQTIAPKVIDLNETVEGMLKMLRRLIGENINLIWQPGVSLWPIKIDPSQIDQILANFCVNARDAIAGVGKMTVETGNSALDEEYCANHEGCRPGDYVRLAVSDSGSGMDQETLSHIFEPFFTTKGVGEGTGLGLATVYGIVKQNKGFINVDSKPGKGTTFTIYLPRHREHVKPIHKEKAPETALDGQETLLLVEDEHTVLKIAATMLRRLGYTILEANTPIEAISLADQFVGEIHLLLTDVIMPEMHGRDLAERLLGKYPDMKCLFMSGYTANVISHRGVLDEGVNFIQKPFSQQELAAMVRSSLKGANS